MPALKIEAGASAPPFEQLREQLIEQIMGRVLPAGTKLPPVRGLAEQLGIAPGTVARAYRELEAEGYVITQGRGGTIVAPIAAADAQTAERGAALAGDYVAQMRLLGFGDEAILAEVNRHLN